MIMYGRTGPSYADGIRKGNKMYEALVAHLRECAKLDKSNNTYEEAADAIEELQKALEAVNDAHNEGYDVGYWAGRRDYEPKWIPVSEKLPEANVDVLALYEWAGQFHKEEKYTYICRASYIPKNTIRVDDKWAEVWEETDSYYVPEGWYEECSQGNSDYMSYHIGATVTHWQYLPQPPKEEQK